MKSKKAKKEKRPSWADVMPLYLADIRRRNHRPTTISTMEIISRRIIRDFGDSRLDRLTRVEFAGFVDRYSLDFAQRISAIIRWACRQQMIEHDVTCHALPLKHREDRIPPSYLSPSEAQRFWAQIPDKHKPAFALAMYAGLRPYEVCRLRWENISVQERWVKIPSHVSKTRHARIIQDVPTILWAQLALAGNQTGHVLRPTEKGNPNFPLWLHERRNAFKRSHVPARHDVLRHSFATYFVALTGSPDRAAKVLGHCDLRMLAKHYDGVALKADAQQYFHPKPILALPAPSS